MDRPLWKHRLTVVEPDQIVTDAALLIIGGGSNNKAPQARVNPLQAMVAVTTCSVVAELRMVPNQPLTFAGENQTRTEDGIIVYSWDKYLRTGDETWPLRLPMTKSVVRAMDAITALWAAALPAAASTLPGLSSQVHRSGAGRRGPPQPSTTV